MSKGGEIKTLFGGLSAAEGENLNTIDKMGEVEVFDSDTFDRLKILYAGMPNRETLNVYRELRTQLLQIAKKKNFVCMVCCPVSGGGATHVAANLAAVFALDKAKTSMLVDANLYAPDLEKLIVSGTSLGITDYLSNPKVGVQDIVYATGIQRVRAVPIGGNSEGAAEYFSSDKMRDFMDEVKNRYSDRFIFIDSPPILESSEARIIAEVVDIVVLVVPYGQVTDAEVRSAIDAVGTTKLAGVVYNNG